MKNGFYFFQFLVRAAHHSPLFLKKGIWVAFSLNDLMTSITAQAWTLFQQHFKTRKQAYLLRQTSSPLESLSSWRTAVPPFPEGPEFALRIPKKKVKFIKLLNLALQVAEGKALHTPRHLLNPVQVKRWNWWKPTSADDFVIMKLDANH